MALQLATAEQEYSKYKNLRKEDVMALQEWIKKQPHLPPITELQVIQFFQSCYFKTEATKSAIEAYFTLKNQWPEYFLERDPRLPSLRDAMDVSLITVLPNLTPDGYSVIFATLMDYDVSKFGFMSYLKLFDMVGTLWLAEHGTAEGMVLVFDMKHTTLAHLSTLTIIGMKNLFYYLQEALPTRLKGMHYINTGVVMDKLMLLMKPFIKKELLEILHTHAKVNENLFRYVPQQCLPHDYGGSVRSLAELHAEMKKTLLGNANYLIEQEKLIADESKRLEKRDGGLQGYGMDGSFKKLNID